MIVDSSAWVAVLRDEPEAPAFARRLEAEPTRTSAATLLETALVAGPTRHEDIDDLVARSRTEVVAFDETQLRLAREEHVRYGRGSGSTARLNLGDCFSYALAKSSGEPLLFKGDDFVHTDVTPAT